MTLEELIEQARELIQTRGLVHMQDLLNELDPELDKVTRAVDALIAQGAVRPYMFAPRPEQALAYHLQLGGGRVEPVWGPGTKVFWYLARTKRRD